MFENRKSLDLVQNLRLMTASAKSITADESDITANLANISAVIYLYLDRINWAGFYIFDGSELVLGPFQGKPACVRIQIGRGVCGTAAKEGRPLIVPDVSAFPGHIACDAESRSEIVIPIFKADGALYGVLDIDSPEIGRFTDAEGDALSEIAELIKGMV